MSGLNLSTGLTGSVVGGLYPNGSSAAAPTRTAMPEGPTTVAAAAYGGGAAGSGASNAGVSACLVGAAAIGLLLFMWWGLPRLGGGRYAARFHVGRSRRRGRGLGLAQVRQAAPGREGVGA